jgi:methylglutaconyl-CoA hydratase
MAEPSVLCRIEGGVARVTLNRPEVRNAFDEALIGEMTATLTRLGGDQRVRFVVLAGAGGSFSAGADLQWMQRASRQDFAGNLADAERLAALMATLDGLAKPTLALVEGAAYGGGVGLVACVDVAIAGEDARFCLAEVRLGLVPAVIGPYVVRAIGERAARRYLLTAEAFGAEEALRLGLVHELAPAGGLEAALARMLDALAAGGAGAQAAAKAVIARVGRGPIDRAMTADMARRIAEARAAPEGREGVAAFLEKRKPAWRT